MSERGGRTNPGRGGTPPRGRPRGQGRASRGGRKGAGHKAPRSSLGVRRLDDGSSVLVHPPCVEERADDYREGIEIWRAGEPEEAREVLRYALEGCGDNLWIHVALGRIALEADRDASLARGHFGYAVELGRKAMPPGFAGRLPRDRPENRPLYEALDGLIASLVALGQHGQADELRGLAARWSGGAEAG